MKYRVEILQEWTYEEVIDAESRVEAEEIAGDIAVNISPFEEVMQFKDEYIELIPIAEELE